MRRIFRADHHERAFKENGYVVVDLLGGDAIRDLWSFYSEAFETKREVVPYARDLPYYISVFDSDNAHKREVDGRIGGHVEPAVKDILIDYEVFYSNFMIKFPGDGQIEAHQDFNFVDESCHVAFNLWCPLVEVDLQLGGLCVIPGSHKVFTTQRGPNLPKALTEYNDLLKRYARWLPVERGQAAIFDHRLVHYSPPNSTGEVRVAVQSVLKPIEASAIHYVHDRTSDRVSAYRIDKDFILNSDLWSARLDDRDLDHEQDLIPLVSADEAKGKLVDLRLRNAKSHGNQPPRPVFKDSGVQREFEQNGFVKLALLDGDEVSRLNDVFVESTGGTVENSEYGMYISLEEADQSLRTAIAKQISAVVLPKAERHFLDCKPHLGSFLVKAPDDVSYTYPHQDWTFVDSPRFSSITVWIALVDTDEENGTLGFVRGSHLFFDKPVGSPSPEFRTCSQGHETIFFQYLEFLPLRAGEAVAFDNRTIHGAAPNRTSRPRIAAAVGMTPREAQLYHHFLVPGSLRDNWRSIAKLAVDESFFENHSVTKLKARFLENRIPEGCEVAATREEEFIAFGGDEIREMCERSGLKKNGRELRPGGAESAQIGGDHQAHAGGMGLVRRFWNVLQSLGR